MSYGLFLCHLPVFAGVYALTTAQVFLIARIFYVPAYALGLTGVRTLLWLIGFAATVALFLMALMA